MVSRPGKLTRRLFGANLLRMVRYALTSFNLRVSLPRTALSTLGLLLRRRRIGAPERPAIVTFSIFEDHARLWLHFARRALGDEWDFVVVDCSGGMDPLRLADARVLKLFNFSHGGKIDLLLRHLAADVVFLLDDDKYLSDGEAVDRALGMLQDPANAAVSLVPRHWWKFRLGERQRHPMGSQAVLLKRPLFRQHRLSFRTRRQVCEARVDARGAQLRRSYDTGDHANEQLLRLGYDVPSLEPTGRRVFYPRSVEEHHESILGFDGATAMRLMIAHVEPEAVLDWLSGAARWNEDSLASYFFKSTVSGLMIDRLVRAVLAEAPSTSLPLDLERLTALVAANPHARGDDLQALLGYLDRSLATASRLAGTGAAEPQAGP